MEGKSAVDAGLAYVLENLSGNIRLSEAARLAFMSEPSFSKYFKKGQRNDLPRHGSPSTDRKRVPPS